MDRRGQKYQEARRKEFSHLQLPFNTDDSCSVDIYLTGWDDAKSGRRCCSVRKAPRAEHSVLFCIGGG
jgi:hypothetical protein